MKSLFSLVAVALLTFACTGQQGPDLSYFDAHCREHAADMYAEDFAPERYNECLDLHMKGIVLSESTDQHLASMH